MRRPSLPLVLALVVAAGLLGLAAALRHRPDQLNLVPLPMDMVRSPALSSGGSTERFPDGLVQRTPPEGSVARGHLPLGYGPGPEEAVRAGRELVNPVPAGDGAGVARGKLVFARVCAGCHGAGARADAPATLRGVPPPPTLIRPETRAMPDGEMFHAITFGRKNMPAFALQLPPEDRWKAIRFLRTLQESP
jgi:mono/diheme cytochrome c family protein